MINTEIKTASLGLPESGTPAFFSQTASQNSGELFSVILSLHSLLTDGGKPEVRWRVPPVPFWDPWGSGLQMGFGKI